VGWPDWWGQAVAIVASGPSTKKEDVALLQGRLRVIAIKQNVEIAPWAEVVYGCDRAWWRHVRGLPDFKGLKVAYDDRACREFGLQRVEVLRVQTRDGRYPGGFNPKADHLVFDPAGTIGSGGCSGFQALNLAVQWGATRVLLIGMDCNGKSGTHWYGRNNATGMSNPGEEQYTRWAHSFDSIAGQLADVGVEVVNAAPKSTITAYPKRGVAETLEAWGL
jgi:hypothetical protein